ncbi:DNA (cytosine-5-)-methyltransferase [soil metagenome]
MEYVEHINQTLVPRISEDEVVLDLFAGCGGLALGFEAAGFETIGFEMDPAASQTYRENLVGKCFTEKLETSFNFPDADVIIGGPPCQPFSVGGNQLGFEDARDGFPIFIDAVKRLQPKVFLFENVRGLLYANKWYFELIIRELQKLGYIIEFELMNAVNFGVPQNRERLFVVGHRSSYMFPKVKTRKVTVEEAIGDTMKTAPLGSKFLTASMDEYVLKYEKASYCVNPRDLYPDKPARTLTCRNLAGATGDMQRVRLEDGSRRRLNHGEAARLQSFPDWFQFKGNETQRFNQIGNAVPPLLAYQIALEIRACLRNEELYSAEQIRQERFDVNNTRSLFSL